MAVLDGHLSRQGNIVTSYMDRPCLITCQTKSPPVFLVVSNRWTGLLDWITGSNQTTSKSHDAHVAHQIASSNSVALF